MRNSDIRALYYITHIDNLPSILFRGILSHERVITENIQNTPIYDEDIVEKRGKRYTPDGKNLWHYVNLFFQPRNSMLFRVIESEGKQNLTVLRVSNMVLQRQGICIADGIAATELTRIYTQSEGLQVLQAQWEMLQSESWVSWNHSYKVERQLMAECLIPTQIDPKDIQRFIVSDQKAANSLRAHLSPSNIQKLVVATDIGSNMFTPFN